MASFCRRCLLRVGFVRFACFRWRSNLGSISFSSLPTDLCCQCSSSSELEYFMPLCWFEQAVGLALAWKVRFLLGQILAAWPLQSENSWRPFYQKVTSARLCWSELTAFYPSMAPYSPYLKPLDLADPKRVYYQTPQLSRLLPSPHLVPCKSVLHFFKSVWRPSPCLLAWWFLASSNVVFAAAGLARSHSMLKCAGCLSLRSKAGLALPYHPRSCSYLTNQAAYRLSVRLYCLSSVRQGAFLTYLTFKSRLKRIMNERLNTKMSMKFLKSILYQLKYTSSKLMGFWGFGVRFKNNFWVYSCSWATFIF